MSIFFELTKGNHLEDNTSLSFKFNLNEYTEKEIDEFCNNIAIYVHSHSHGEHIFFQGGYHYNGQAEIPHLHLNFCVQHWHPDKNESRRRGTFLGGVMPEKLSCKISPLNDQEQLEKLMSYPVKENKIFRYKSQRIISKIEIFPSDVELFLVQNGVAIYQATLEVQRRRARASARCLNIQQQILEIIDGQSFNNYSEYKNFVYNGFYSGLDLNEYPDTSALIKEVGKVAIFKKIVPPHFFDKN